MASDLTIRAKLVEEIVDGVGVPVGVNIKGAEFLAPSALLDIAHEVLDSHSGDYSREYIGILPDWEMRSDDMTIKVIKRRV